MQFKRGFLTVKPRPSRPLRAVPRGLLAVHRRAQQVGVRRAVAEASVAAGAIATLLFGVAEWIVGEMPSVLLVMVAFAVVGGLMATLLFAALPMVQELLRTRQESRLWSQHDASTGIVSRRHFSQLAHREWERCRRYRSGASMLMVDVDHLDIIREDHGEQAADTVLRSIALACDGMLRKPDLLGRYNPSALMVFLPHTDVLGAVDVAERLRSAVAASRVPWGKRPIRVTVSVGVVSLGDAHLSLSALMLDAEVALQAAQEAGRNCVRSTPGKTNRDDRSYPVMG